MTFVFLPFGFFHRFLVAAAETRSKNAKVALVGPKSNFATLGCLRTARSF